MSKQLVNIFPAIDLINGQCVRLTKGDYNQKKIYNEDPVQVAKDFNNAGMKWLHIVDLDGAKTGKMNNFESIKKIIKNTSLNIQVGGGIRSLDDIKKYLEYGVSRVILGSAAIKNQQFLKDAIDIFGNKKIILGLDIKNGHVAISGWTEDAGMTIYEFLLNNTHIAIKHILVTDVAQDGTLNGPNFILYKKLMQKFPQLEFIASGGISQITDVKKLIELGMSEIIVGKALYEKKNYFGRIIFYLNIL